MTRDFFHILKNDEVLLANSELSSIFVTIGNSYAYIINETGYMRGNMFNNMNGQGHYVHITSRQSSQMLCNKQAKASYDYAV